MVEGRVVDTALAAAAAMVEVRVVDTAVMAAAAMVEVRVVDTHTSDGGGGDGEGEGGGYGGDDGGDGGGEGGGYDGDDGGDGGGEGGGYGGDDGGDGGGEGGGYDGDDGGVGGGGSGGDLHEHTTCVCQYVHAVSARAGRVHGSRAESAPVECRDDMPQGWPPLRACENEIRARPARALNPATPSTRLRAGPSVRGADR